MQEYVWTDPINDPSQVKYNDFLSICDLEKVRFGGWVMNHIKTSGSLRGRFKPIITTKDGKTPMALLEYDSSSCIIFGHNGLTSDTKSSPIFENSIKYIEAKMRFN
jgi:hypothetical protein